MCVCVCVYVCALTKSLQEAISSANTGKDQGRHHSTNWGNRFIRLAGRHKTIVNYSSKENVLSSNTGPVNGAITRHDKEGGPHLFTVRGDYAAVQSKETVWAEIDHSSRGSTQPSPAHVPTTVEIPPVASTFSRKAEQSRERESGRTELEDEMQSPSALQNVRRMTLSCLLDSCREEQSAASGSERIFVCV